MSIGSTVYEFACFQCDPVPIFVTESQGLGFPLLDSLERRPSLKDKTCPKCGFTITPDQVKRIDFERMECPKCGERFQSEP